MFMDIDSESNIDYRVPTNVLKITTQLPVELQCLILKDVILKRFKKPYYFEPPTKEFDGEFHDILYSAEFPAQIASLLGVHLILDNVMTMVLQEMDFDENLLKSQLFDKIANFVISRSTQINLFQSIMMDHLMLKTLRLLFPFLTVVDHWSFGSII
ncbi:unnamed protein product [Ambrosiozyma monospora]|uniref:Unnamed protein product n=1 Tax=Ambrosiozyma monospora TaxID=43982 RepID=A0ACB5SYH0_AMBMO|nr:unnamed protein product [Ambrosiozyma monospora]